jgi:hypothetical protein
MPRERRPRVPSRRSGSRRPTWESPLSRRWHRHGHGSCRPPQPVRPLLARSRSVVLPVSTRRPVLRRVRPPAQGVPEPPPPYGTRRPGRPVRRELPALSARRARRTRRPRQRLPARPWPPSRRRALRLPRRCPRPLRSARCEPVPPRPARRTPARRRPLRRVRAGLSPAAGRNPLGMLSTSSRMPRSAGSLPAVETAAEMAVDRAGARVVARMGGQVGDNRAIPRPGRRGPCTVAPLLY